MATDVHHADNVLAITTPTPDPRATLMLNTYLDTDRLIGFVQPTIWSDHGIDTARRAVQAAETALCNARYLADLETAHRLQRAIAAANEVVLSANRARCGNSSEARVGVGMALCLRSARKASIALVPPIQVMLFQGSTAIWYPRRESWIGDDPGLAGSPLGWCATAQPTIVSTVVEHRDELLLTTSSVATILAPLESMSNSGAVCDQIACLSQDADPMELVALSTRFEARSVTGSLRSTTRHVFGQVDRRARAIWTALRHPD